MDRDNIHYIFGLKKDFGKKPWCYFHYLSIKSAKVINSNYKIHFWYQYEPSGIWWDQAKQYIDEFHYIELPEILDNKAQNYAHVSDIQRLKILKEYGGIYIDSDVICLRPFVELNNSKFWMGKQGRTGLCNATMGASTDSQFLDIWLESSKVFNPNDWDEFSVRRPYKLAKMYPNLITVYPEDYFFVPCWYEQKKIMHLFKENKNRYLTNSYSVHLWESVNYDLLKNITPNTIKKNSELGILCNLLI